MGYREILLIIAIILSGYCIFISLNRIQLYDQKYKMKKSLKTFFIYISILIPVVGFFLTRRLRIQ